MLLTQTVTPEATERLAHDWAERRAHDWFAAGAPLGTKPVVHLARFDLGWLAWAEYVDGVDETPAPVTESAVAVIDLDTGVITAYPSLPACEIITSYRMLRHGLDDPAHVHITSVVTA